MGKRNKKKIPMSVRKPVSQYVCFIKSPFKGRPPVMFYPYPSYVGEDKDEFGRVFFKHYSEVGPYVMRFKISETTNIYNAVVNTCKAAGMYLVNEKLMLWKKKKYQESYSDSGSSDEEDYKDENEDDFNILFTGAVKEEILKKARTYQRLSHFPHSYNIGRKDAMWRNFAEMQEAFPDEYDYCPRTFVFPQDAEDYEEHKNELIKSGDIDHLWIFKPSASSCGKGIRIMTLDTPIPVVKRGFVISDYIANPHLIEGLKYDLRVYVLVTSFDPLIAYMYEDGLVRFATDKFSLDPSKFENMFVHLTNYSIQKKSEAYQQNKAKGPSNLKASKWSLKTLQKVFEDHNKDYVTVKKRMHDLIIKTLISVEDPINKAMKAATPHNNLCFELYGFDIMIDSDLKPWILEVNISPSFSSSSPFDKNLKTKLICDSLTIVGVRPTNHEKYVKEENQKVKQALSEEGKEESKSSIKSINNISSEKIDTEDVKLLLDFEEQKLRCQNFDLIFPVASTYRKYVKFFNEKRYNNYLLWNHIREPLISLDDYLV